MDEKILKFLNEALSENSPKRKKLQEVRTIKVNSKDSLLPPKKGVVINQVLLQPFHFKKHLLEKVHFAKIAFKPHFSVSRIEPAEIIENPVSVEQFLFFPDERSRKIYYISAELFLTDFSMTVDKQEAMGTNRITGAKATISVSLYAEDDLEQAQAILERNEILHSYRNWKMSRLNVRDLKPSLLLDARSVNHINHSASTDSGTATFLMDLTESGAQDFLNAIQSGRPDTLRGICKIDGKTYVKKQNNTHDFRPLSLQLALGKLLRHVSMEQVRIVNAQTSLQSTVVVTANMLIEDVTVSLKTNNFVAEEFFFGKDGGRALLSITDLNFDDLQVELVVLVNYVNPVWPVIESRKQLSFRDTNWADIIDPASWLRNYRIITYLYDQNGQILDNTDSLQDRVTVEFVYKASYLQNATHEVISVVETASHSVEEVSVPIPNDEEPGTLQLRVFAQRSSPGGQLIKLKNRELDFDATLVVVKVLHDGTIEIISNTDPENESGKKNKGLLLLESLTRGRVLQKSNTLAPFTQLVEEEQDEMYEDELATLSLISESNPPPLAIPVADPLSFAPIPDTELYWPVESSDPQGRLVSYQAEDGRFIGNRSRRFLADRSGGTRYHVGIDLYGRPGDPVIAIEDGKILSFYHFYSDTYALFVEHSSMTVNYGEVHSESLRENGLQVGDYVRGGQKIGSVGRLRSGNSMCHFETYVLGTRSNKRWLQSEKRPEGMLNPTALLLHLQRSGLSRNSADSGGSPGSVSIGIDLSKAISLNRKYGNSLGWELRREEISVLLGFLFMTPTESAFAEAVAGWQRYKGFREENVDGVIGPNTWRTMQEDLVTVSESEKRGNGFISSSRKRKNLYTL